MAVIIGSVIARDTEVDNPTLNLNGVWGVHALTVGERTFVYAAGASDSGISGFELGADGSLTSIQNISDDATLELGFVSSFASVTVGGTSYLYANADIDAGISAFRIATDGRLTSIQNISDDAILNLAGSFGEPTVATVGGISFLIAAGYDDSGFSVFRVGDDGKLTNTDNETDGGDLEIIGATETATATVGGRTFIFVAGFADDGLSVFELDSNGTVTNTDNVSDDATLDLALPSGLATATIGVTTYLVTSSNSNDGLSVFSVSDTGQLANVFNVSDNAVRGLDGAAGLTAFTLDTETFVAVSGESENALGVFHLGADGTLTDVTTIFDNASLALDDTFGNTFAIAGDIPILIGAGSTDDGLSTFDLGSGSDTLLGTGDADLLLGLAGNDLLDGGAGTDRMLGGSGDDSYFVDSAGDEVVEQALAGTDTVHASISTTLGANVENLVLTGSAALNGTGNELDNVLTGNAGANRLLGKAGRDDLEGGKQADTLLGGRGKDTLAGQGGSDDFVFTSLKDSGNTARTRDVIEDFRGRDDIVLTRIDAVKSERGNQAFELDTNGNFDAGEIRFRDTRAGVIVDINVDGDARAEMLILVRGSGTLDAGDFLF